MIFNHSEVQNMTNAQSNALVEAIRIITELAQTPEQLKDALDRIQSILKNPKQ